jgi:hypothetical protein
MQTINIMTQNCSRHGQNDPASLTIADAFACLGGNTYSFYVTFKSVVAYEKDKTRFNCLQQNVQDYPIQETKPPVLVLK